MQIKYIHVSNFRSFSSLKLQLSDFNVMIGTNASGKSNFVQIFSFLRDVMRDGLDNAISMQGGVEYLRNIKIGESKPFSIFVAVGEKNGKGLSTSERDVVVLGKHRVVILPEATYKLSLKFDESVEGYSISEDIFTVDCELDDGGDSKKRPAGKKRHQIKIFRRRGNLSVSSTLGITLSDILETFFGHIPSAMVKKVRKIPRGRLVIEVPLYHFFTEILILREIAIYDFDPKLPKRAIPVGGKTQLEGDASNLSLVLKNLLKDQEKKQELFTRLKNILPFVSDLDMMKLADKFFLFSLKEKYYDDYLPASLVSDGTINVIALVIALFFGETRVPPFLHTESWRPMKIIEEPEKNVHPHAIAQITQMLEAAAEREQIIVTTHNPEVVKYTKPENLLLVSRDEESGFTIISRPMDKEIIRSFLDGKVPIDELYVQNLLEM